MFTLANEPEGIGRILDNGFRLCFVGYRTILKFIGVTSLLFIAIFALYGVLYGSAIFSMIAAYQRGNIPTTGKGMYLGFMAIITLASFFYSNAVTLKYGMLGKGQEISVTRCLAIGARKIVPVVVYMFWYALIIMVSSLPLIILMLAVRPGMLLTIVFVSIGIIPAVIFMISLILGSYAIILDDTGIFAAIKRSHTLVWGKWWRTFVYTIIVSMIFMTLLVTIELVLEFGSELLMSANPNHYPIITASALLLNQIVSMFFIPFVAALTIAYYHDLKLRKEGGDLEARIDAA